jgi:hypothetical protein
MKETGEQTEETPAMYSFEEELDSAQHIRRALLGRELASYF